VIDTIVLGLIELSKGRRRESDDRWWKS